jgi:hypothetical protein
MSESWKQIDGLLYEVSDLGRVRRSAPGRGTFVGRIIKPNLTKGGYWNIGIGRKSGGRTRLVHQLVAEAFLGRCPDGQEVNHKNGVKTDNHASNLEYVTRSENAKHAFRIGLCRPHVAVFGPSHHNAKLSEMDVRVIRRLGESCVLSLAEMALLFGVYKQHIWRIVRGKARTHDGRNAWKR